MSQCETDDMSCVLCGSSFALPLCPPLLLPCTHLSCSYCLKKAESQQESHIVCPVDLEANAVREVRADPSTRRLLQKVAQEQKKYSQNSQLLRIQALSKHF